MRRNLRATIEPMSHNQWIVSGPWAELIVERNPAEPAEQWIVRPKNNEPGGNVGLYTRFDRGLSDAYSRAMGFTR